MSLKPTYTIQNCNIEIQSSERSKAQFELACAIRILAEGLKIPDNNYGIYIAHPQEPAFKGKTN